MVKRSVRERLIDISVAIGKIERFLVGQSFETFSGDALIHDAVVRNLEIISEASRHIPVELKTKAPQIEWKAIADFGNLLRHGYETVNDHILWDTTQRDLQKLMAVVRSFLDDPKVE